MATKSLNALVRRLAGGPVASIPAALDRQALVFVSYDLNQVKGAKSRYLKAVSRFTFIHIHQYALYQSVFRT